MLLFFLPFLRKNKDWGGGIMRNYDEVMDGLRQKAQKFQKEYDEKNYLAAMWTYNDALTIAVFVGLENKEYEELFGEREDDKMYKEGGLFKEEYVERARLWCIRNNMTRQQVVETGYRAKN